MKISTKGRYALRVIIDLAEHDNGAFVPLKDIAGRQEISEKYLESIVAILVKGNFIEGLRGKGGGYRLSRSPESLSVGEVLTLVEGSIAPVACLDCKPNRCHRAEDCKTLPMWTELERRINEYLNEITIADLANTASCARVQYFCQILFWSHRVQETKAQGTAFRPKSNSPIRNACSVQLCLSSPRYRVFRYLNIFVMTAKTCSTFTCMEDFSSSCLNYPWDHNEWLFLCVIALVRWTKHERRSVVNACGIRRTGLYQYLMV